MATVLFFTFWMNGTVGYPRKDDRKRNEYNKYNERSKMPPTYTYSDARLNILKWTAVLGTGHRLKNFTRWNNAYSWIIDGSSNFVLLVGICEASSTPSAVIGESHHLRIFSSIQKLSFDPCFNPECLHQKPNK